MSNIYAKSKCKLTERFKYRKTLETLLVLCSFMWGHEQQQVITPVVVAKFMSVKMVVLPVSTTRAREEELIREISDCCLCSATLGPLGHTTDWTLLDYMLLIQSSPGCPICCVTSFPLPSRCPEATVRQNRSSSANHRSELMLPYCRLHLTQRTCRAAGWPWYIRKSRVQSPV